MQTKINEPKINFHGRANHGTTSNINGIPYLISIHFVKKINNCFLEKKYILAVFMYYTLPARHISGYGSLGTIFEFARFIV